MLRRSALLSMSGALLLLAACGSDMASSVPAPVAMRATLSGAQEVPPTNTQGSGTATITFNQATKQLSWNVTFGGLTGPTTAAHFHGPAAPGANAGVVVPVGGAGMASPVSGQIVLNDAQAADLLAGRWYLNIHTAANPGGEIRGQVMR